MRWLLALFFVVAFAAGVVVAQDAAIGSGRMVGSLSNCRAGPDLRFNALLAIPRDAVVPVLAFAADEVPGDNIFGWTQVEYEGVTCWVADFLIAVDATPTPEILPSATPMPTVQVSPTMMPSPSPMPTGTSTPIASVEVGDGVIIFRIEIEFRR